MATIPPQGGILPGDDSILASDPSNDISGDFDLLSIPPSTRFRGGNDQIEAVATQGDNLIQGDVGIATASGGGSATIKGGNDKIKAASNSTNFLGGQPMSAPIAANVVAGDVGFAQVSPDSSVKIWGGKDHIKTVAKNGGNVIAGDVGATDSVGGSVQIRGGYDVIESFSAEGSELAGDVGAAIAPNGRITIKSGNDRIISKGNSNDKISGDILQASGKVTVTYGNDYIVAGGGNDEVFGDYDPARVTGAAATGGGSDVLIGVDSIAGMPGIGEVDELWGNGGKDTFVLGTRQNIFYLGNGGDDFARINDFGYQGDQDWIQLKRGGGSDGFKSYSFAGVDGNTEIFFKEDLIAVVEGATITEVENSIVWA